MDKSLMLVKQNIMKNTEKELYLPKKLKKKLFLVTQQSGPGLRTRLFQSSAFLGLG